MLLSILQEDSQSWAVTRLVFAVSNHLLILSSY